MTTAQQSIDVNQVNTELEAMSAIDRVAWAAENFGAGAVLLSSMQKTASVLMHLYHRLGLENEILFVDTGFHFHETLETRDLYMRRFKLNVVTLYPQDTPLAQEERFGHKLHLFVDGQKECCRLRKEEPFVGYVREHHRNLVMVGLRRAEGGHRGDLEILSKDPRIGGYAMRPIADWTDEQIADYIQEHDLPVHPLHAQDYPSIGCACCTTPVEQGEDPRAGRWRHLRELDEDGPQYCGINFTDGAGI
jgi:phosphoadenosine phosphosulfate reductase